MAAERRGHHRDGRGLRLRTGPWRIAGAGALVLAVGWAAWSAVGIGDAAGTGPTGAGVAPAGAGDASGDEVGDGHGPGAREGRDDRAGANDGTGGHEARTGDGDGDDSHGDGREDDADHGSGRGDDGDSRGDHGAIPGDGDEGVPGARAGSPPDSLVVTLPMAGAGGPGADAGSGAPPRVFVAGDSLTVTSTRLDDPGLGSPVELEVAAGLGWGVPEAQPLVDRAMAEGPIDVLVVALGTNDASPAEGRDGWAEADVARFRQLMGTVGDDSCVVVVLPGHGTGIDQAHAREIDRARDGLTALAAERRAGGWYGPTVVVDWQERIDELPGIIASDGIHLVTPRPGAWPTDAVAAERTAIYWDGVAACALGPT